MADTTEKKAPAKKPAAKKTAEAVVETPVAAEGHEAVIVSHQLPIWVTRQALEGRRLWHDPRRRECSVASLTSLHWDGDRLTGITYSEPAVDLLPVKPTVAGA